jgi:hypothetical protein
MSKKKVKTVNNKEICISKCRKYPSGYYKIGDIKIENSGDCYKIDNKYYRFETGQIVFNHTINEHVFKTNNLYYGLVEKNKMGYFENTPNKIKIYSKDSEIIYAINEDILINNYEYREKLNDGCYYHISLISSFDFKRIQTPENSYKTSLPYDSKGITDKHLQMYNYLYDSKISNNTQDFSVLLEDLTFGLEFETIKGYVPERITKKLGLIPLRDGSITGLEYVTVPFKGAKGLQTLNDISKELEKRTIFTHQCSLHLHLGNVPRTPEFILAFFKLTLSIQEELFSLFPMYKKYNLGIKNKNYSSPYNVYNLLSKMDPSIDKNNLNSNFSILLDYLGEETGFYETNDNDLKNIKYHPRDPSGNQKWNIKTRYFFHNFIPLIFGNKQTIEFRIHTPTYDINKINFFIGLNSILINFCKNNTEIILKDPNFLINNSKLIKIIENHLLFTDKNSVLKKNKKLSINAFYDYFKNTIYYRKNAVETLTRQGNIIIEENDIYVKPIINWNDPKTILSDHKDYEDQKNVIEENEANLNNNPYHASNFQNKVIKKTRPVKNPSYLLDSEGNLNSNIFLSSLGNEAAQKYSYKTFYNDIHTE